MYDDLLVIFIQFSSQFSSIFRTITFSFLKRFSNLLMKELTNEEASQFSVSAQGSRKLLSVDLHSSARTAASDAASDAASAAASAATSAAATAAAIPIASGSTAAANIPITSCSTITNSAIAVDDYHLHHLLPGSGLIGGLAHVGALVGLGGGGDGVHRRCLVRAGRGSYV